MTPEERAMIDPDLLEILVCPETKQSLSEADGRLVALLNEAIERGEVQNRAGEALGAPVDGGLVREDRQVLYPIRDRIPVMLIDEAIPLGGWSASSEDPPTNMNSET